MRIASTGYQSFYKEFPWHESCHNFNEWNEPCGSFGDVITVGYMVPVVRCEWDGGVNDLSLEYSLSVYLPSPCLIGKLELSSKVDEFGIWRDRNGIEAFIDPSINEDGPSYALMRSDLIESWLEKNNYMLVWLIEGEKRLYDYTKHKLFGRKKFSGAFISSGGIVEGDDWVVDVLCSEKF